MSIYFRFQKAAIAAVAAVSLCGAVIPVSAAPAQWVSGWTANPVGSTGVILPGTQTLREIISPRRAGNMVRLRLTNREGSLQVKFSEVWIGTQQVDAQLVAGSNKKLTFGGKSDVAIPPGGDVLSDPLPYAVTPFTKLAISMQTNSLLSLPAVSSTHAVSRETNYYSLLLPRLGGGAAREAGTGFLPFVLTAGVTFQASWHYISGLDVQTTDNAPRTIVAFGDSITDGLTVNPTTDNTFIEDLSTLGLEQRYPDFLQRRFAATTKYKSHTLVNAGIAGNRLAAGPFAPFFGPSGLSRLGTDVIAVPGVTDVIVHMGINDIAFDLPAQVSQSHAIGGTLITAFTDLIGQLHAKGIRVVLATIMPARGAGLGTFSPTVNAGAAHGSKITDDIRIEVNTWIRNQGKAMADGVIDFDACMRDPARPSYLNPAYDSGDHLHPTGVGYSVMAGCVNMAVFP